MSDHEPQMQAQGLLDVFKLADKELIDKVLAIAKTIHVQQLENGVTRICIDLIPKKD